MAINWTSDEKSKIEAALKDAEEALKSDDKDTIEAKTQALAEASHKLAEKMYSQEQSTLSKVSQVRNRIRAGERKTVEGEVVDAEFEEVKNKK